MLWILFAGGIFDNAGPAEQLLRSGGGLTIKMVKGIYKCNLFRQAWTFSPDACQL